MSKSDVGKVKPVEDYVVTQHGSGPFRAFNFELYAVRTMLATCGHLLQPQTQTKFALQRPTGFMRLAAYAGTTAFVGILGYMFYEKNRLEAADNQRRRQV